MNRIIGCLAAAAIAIAVPMRASAYFEAGFAVREITPPASLSGICLGGYGALTCRQATGVHDPIYVRAMVVYNSTTNTTVALAVMDVAGASNRVVKSVIAKVNSPSVIIPGTNIVIAETHSHATPDLVGLWGKVPADYKTYVTDQAAAAIKAAHASRVRANLYLSATSHAQQNNRRGWNGTDQALTVIDAANASTGVRIGTLVSYAGHPTILPESNTLVSRDWIGAVVDRAEATLGAGKVMFFNGAQGDVSPKTDLTGGATDYERVANYGAAVADAALAAMNQGQTLIGDYLKFSRTGFDACVTNQSFLSALSIGAMDYDSSSAIGSCSWVGVLPPRKIATQVAYLRLGTQVQAAIVPGEMLTRMAIDNVGATGYPYSTGSVKGAMKAPTRVILGLGTDFLGYFVPADEWNGKNPAASTYEEGVSLGGSGANTWLRDRVKALISADNATF